MSWQLKGWISGGYCATREDGEIVFIYKRPDWGTGMSGLRRFYELRSHGLLVGINRFINISRLGINDAEAVMQVGVVRVAFNLPLINPDNDLVR